MTNLGMSIDHAKLHSTPGADASVLPRSSHESSEKFHVVGIGLSAGGLVPLKEILNLANGNSTACYVIISHISRSAKNDLGYVVNRYSNLKTSLIEDGMALKPSAIFIIPPNKYVRVMDGVFVLSDRPSDHINHAANIFFSSLSHNFKEMAVAVVLSGGLIGQDGAEGVVEVKSFGGRTFAQDPDTALHPYMPQAAIATGAIDVIADARSIGAALAQLGIERLSEPIN